MRFLFLILLASQSLYAHEVGISDIKAGNNAEQVSYASYYADRLIEDFDALLDQKLVLNDSESPMYSEVYAKIMSARSFIEKFQGSQKLMAQPTISIAQIRNTKLYQNVVNEINSTAQLIMKEQSRMKQSNQTDSVIYPSISSAGNVTGNTFPKNVWSLTFDDGPRSTRTATVVDNLYRRNMKATFFMLTAEAKKFTDEALNVKNSGMYIALHSYTHPDLSKASDSALAYQITQAKNDLEDLVNVETKVFRLPYGAGTRSQKIRKLIADNGYIHIFWNIDTLDWKDKDPKSILARMKKEMALTPNKSGVILFHDIHAQTVIASEMAMDYMIEKDFKVCPVEEVISFMNGNAEDCLK